MMHCSLPLPSDSTRGEAGEGMGAGPFLSKAIAQMASIGSLRNEARKIIAGATSGQMKKMAELFISLCDVLEEIEKTAEEERADAKRAKRG